MVACARSAPYRTFADTAMHRERHIRRPAHAASIAHVVGTRPNLVKTAPVMSERMAATRRSTPTKTTTGCV